MTAAVDIIDLVSLAGDRGKPNEDRCGGVGNRIWVIDGATDLGEPIMPGRSDAAWIAAEADRAFRRHAGIAEHRAVVEAVSADIARACAAGRQREPEGDWHWPNASFLLVEVGERAVDVCWLGDCRLILSLDGRIVTAGEAGDGEARERASARALAAAAGHAAHRREGAVLDDLRRRRARLLEPGGPRVLGVAPDTAEHLSAATFPRPGPVTGLLMSDGLSALELKYARRTAAAMLAGAEMEGLAQLALEVRSIEEREDPDGERYPRFKRSDDATGLLFRA